MFNFLIESKDDLRAIINNTVLKTGISESVLEKDYWVSFVLEYIFMHEKWKNLFTFKGGTSLSKCFGLIDRFSEDIDLVLDWTALGYEKEEPWKDRSNRGQKEFNEELDLKTIIFIREKFQPCIEKDFRNVLGANVEFLIDEKTHM